MPHTPPKLLPLRGRFGRSKTTSENSGAVVLLAPTSLHSVAKGSAAGGSGYWVLWRQVFGHRLVNGINFCLL